MKKAIRRPWIIEKENELIRFIKLKTEDTIRWSKIKKEDRKANRILRIRINIYSVVKPEPLNIII